jgi:hypothetical protein
MVGERGFQTDFSSYPKALILLRGEAACVTVLGTVSKGEMAGWAPPRRVCLADRAQPPFPLGRYNSHRAVISKGEAAAGSFDIRLDRPFLNSGFLTGKSVRLPSSCCLV